MSYFKFHCPHCGQRIEAALKYVGAQKECPSCCKSFSVPSQPDKDVQPIIDLTEGKKYPQRQFIDILRLILVFPVGGLKKFFQTNFKNKSSRTERNWVLLAWASIILFSCFSYIIYSQIELRSFRNAAVTTQGKFTERSYDEEYSYTKYEFWVNGELFTGAVDGNEDEGSPVKIAYLQEDPRRNARADDKNVGRFGRSLALFISVFGIVMFARGFSQRSFRIFQLDPHKEFLTTSCVRVPVIVASVFTASLIIWRPQFYPDIHAGLLRWTTVITVILLSIYALRWGRKFVVLSLVVPFIYYNPFVPFNIDFGIFDLLSFLILMYIALILSPPSDEPSDEEPQKAGYYDDAQIQYSLGWKYLEGKSSKPVCLEKACYWFRKAADQGHAASQRYLGWCYANGKGVDNDEVEAANWYRKAAENGDALAQRYLGVCYLNGKGVPQNIAESFDWISKAADQGEVASQLWLGASYFQGIGVKNDKVNGYMWLCIAVANGSKEGAELLPVFSKNMTNEEIDEAQRMSHEWKPTEKSLPHLV